jgi:DNA mismatch repair protein MutL
VALEGSRPVVWGWQAPSPAPAGAPLRSEALRPLDLRTRLDPPAALRAPEPAQARFQLSVPPPASTSDEPPRTQRELLPLLRVVGQMGLTYVVAEGPDGMYLIDQHAAHERVVYDRLIARQGESASAQPLLEPALVELDAPLAATLEEHREALAALGLLLEPFGEREHLVRSVPKGVGTRDIGAEVRSLLEQLAAERRVEGSWGRATATVACHASVRAGMALALEEMRRLVEDLEATAAPRTCPHGRPTLIHLGTEAIERQFGRR